jgi:hypothetical protein
MDRLKRWPSQLGMRERVMGFGVIAPIGSTADVARGTIAAAQALLKRLEPTEAFGASDRNRDTLDRSVAATLRR